MNVRNYVLNICCASMACILLMTPFTANAFKVNTHVWIAQEVLNDVVDDGYITIPFKDGNPRVIKIRDEIVSAMRNNPAVFRMGNIGPDAYPDIFTGQMIVHPGVDETKWKSDDWLRYFLSSDFTNNEQGLAFFYGYLGHASADVFAHTYVNQYSGSFFEILKEKDAGLSWPDSLVEEFRHFELEKWISKYDPPILDNNGTNLGEPQNLLAAPEIFLRDRLIFDDEVAPQNPAHLKLIHSLRKNLIGLGDDEFNKMDIWAMKIVVYYYTGYDLSDEDAAKLVEVAKDINTFISENNGVDEAQKAKDAMIASIENVVNIAVETEDRLEQAVIDIFYNSALLTNELNQKLIDAKQDLINLNQQLLDKKNELEKAVSDLSNTPATLERKICNSLPFSGLICDVLYDPNPVYAALLSLISTLESEILNIESSIVAAEAKLTNVEAEIAAVTKELQRAKDVKQATTELIAQAYLTELGITNDVANGVVNMLQEYTSDVNPLRAMVNSWIKDIETAMEEYIKTSSVVIKATMVDGGDAIQPTLDWLECWGPVITGVPSMVTQATCTVKERINELMAALDNFERKMMNMTSITREIQDAKDRITLKISKEVDELVLKLAEEITGIPVRELLDLFTAPASDDRLRTYFSVDRSSNKFKGLLEIPNITERIKSDMAATKSFTEGGKFDPQNFNAIYNAVLLAKIALLDGVGLNQLACELSECPTVPYGTSLYSSTSVNTINSLIDGIKSFDGNHQWMPVAPPYPRRNDYRRSGMSSIDPSSQPPESKFNVDEGWKDGTFANTERSYGYTKKDGKGFRFWQDCNYRNSIFRKVFRGPMNPALETPEVFGYTKILTEKYKNYYYNVTADNPFPTGTSMENETCGEQVVVINNPNDLDGDGLTNAFELTLGTDPNNPDTDGDRMSDYFEVSFNLLPLDPADALLDMDNDGLTNLLESIYNTNPAKPDTDGDGLDDYQEIIVYKTNPRTSDSDLDGMDDLYEINKGFNPNNPIDALFDNDNDNLNNFKEYLSGTDPFSSDTDSDGIPDDYEVNMGLNALDASDAQLDPDNDGLTNTEEFELNTNPLSADTDNDGMQDLFESLYGLSPTVDDAAADYDGDGISNVYEYLNGTDPSGASEKPLTGVKGYGDNKKVKMSWDTNPGARMYNIYWSLTSGVTKATDTKLTDVTTPYEHMGLENGKQYYYVVTAENAFGESPESTEVTAIPVNGLMLIIPLESVPGSGVYNNIMVLP